MDANRQRFWLLADAARYTLGDNAAWDADRRTLSIASQRDLPDIDVSASDYELEFVAGRDGLPEVIDRYGARARVGTDGAVVGDGASGEVRWFEPAPTETVLDLAIGFDDVLYVLCDTALVLVDLRRRWAPHRIPAGTYKPWRLAPAPRGGVWVIEEKVGSGYQLARSIGHPLPDGLQLDPAPGVFRPDPEDPRPPRVLLQANGILEVGLYEQLVAIASDANGRLVALVRKLDRMVVQLFDDERWSDPITLDGLLAAHDIAWHGTDRWAVLAPKLAEVAVYPVSATAIAVQAVGEYHPLVDYDGGPFVHGPPGTPSYRTNGGEVRPVRRLSLPSRQRRAMASLSDDHLFDGGRARFAWHRIVLEADLPSMCAVRIHLAATETRTAPEEEPGSADVDGIWSAHSFGDDPSPGTGVPRGARMPASELPFHPTLLPCPDRPGAGVYTALVQRAGRTTRTLRGRFLHVRIELLGDGRATPEVAALRVYGERFSLVENYLPELYQETVYGADADVEASRTTGADFLERFVGLFEGILTPLEDRIANAHLLTDPATAPDEALDWLAGWLGLGLHPAIPPERRRTLIARAVPLARQRGTLPGLENAIDVITGGAVTRGEVIVVEDFRLRRTFATILGADLRAVDDALTGGLTVTGNSIVGDTLLLGRPERKEFLALFSDDLARTASEEAAVAALYEDLAWRVTVLVQREQGIELLGLVRRTVARCTPAHVEARVVAASHPLVIGLSSLVGVDTYLGRGETEQPIRIGRDRIGADRRVLSPPSLDPDLEYGSAPATDPQGEP